MTLLQEIETVATESAKHLTELGEEAEKSLHISEDGKVDEDDEEADNLRREELAKGMIMEVACASALTGVTLKHGGPFGACVVRNGIFISVAHNTVLMDSDPTCHAEMNAIRYACKALDTHDLSDCELYTTCEPCPMCLGACSWSRIRKIYTGVDRYTAAQFGFDDKVFYDELHAHSGDWAVTAMKSKAKSAKVHLGKTMPNAQPSMLNMYWGIEKELVYKVLGNPQLNRTYRRRIGEKTIGFHGDQSRFGDDIRAEPGANEANPDDSEGEDSTPNVFPEEASKYMRLLEDAIVEACENGWNKEREVFASLIVDRDGNVVSIAVNEVLQRRDSTATSEVLAIRKAAKKLGTYCLEGCSMYSTVEPCVMSLGSILWARIENLYYGLSQHAAARYGFEEGLLHYRELFADPDVCRKVVDTETRVGFDACENVFKRWEVVNGIIY